VGRETAVATVARRLHRIGTRDACLESGVCLTYVGVTAHSELGDVADPVAIAIDVGRFHLPKDFPQLRLVGMSETEFHRRQTEGFDDAIEPADERRMT
jgi:hypothetical protein